jgi:hypothetical protein
MLKPIDHLDNLIRHIELVRENCTLLGKRLIEKGQIEFGRILIARGFVHDASKFYGLEWDYLHAGKDVDKDNLELAIKQHQSTNDHHVEFWSNFEAMPSICIAELVCDITARSQEFGTSIKDWIKENFVTKYEINTRCKKYREMMEFVDLLTQNEFVK